MIVNERYITFINSFRQENSPFLCRIEEEAKASNIPIIRTETQTLLRMLLALKKPQQILEIGTAVGFSALLMLEAAESDVHITTIENYEKRIPKARENFARSGHESCFSLLEGDAKDILPRLDGPYDFIFMDAAKGQYPFFLEDAVRLLAPGGVLVTDNVLQDGDVIESHYALPRRNRTIHKRMRDYLYTLTHRADLVTSILPVGDGVSVSVKREGCKRAQTESDPDKGETN